MGVLLKEIAVSEYPLLENFLYNAIFLAPGEEAPPREIIYEPEIFVYIDGFGNNTGDHGVAAEQVGKIIGMAWHGSSLPMDTSTTRRRSLPYQFCRNIAGKVSEQC